ncbi:hypothetical protein Agub_g12159 [Astrephomene gubernaculifera]|uniref:Uncharacterized protein n=1 Tax=Astrephomene gubernaculifera TaxID=47775 RepID=A0AAD3E276_9CHLO|nr:hypothetical protein Agub_g12159 [Astrephomene gubernaculifera]
MNSGGKRPDPSGAKEPEVAARPSAAPPPCPRCELVKSQCTKTVINYQKSHRKKIDALRAELKSSRSQVQALQRQLRVYKTTSKVVPGLAVLATAGWLLLRLLRRRGGGKGETTQEPEQQGTSEGMAA